MIKVLALSSAVLADAIRRKVVWIVVVFVALLALAIPLLPSYGVGVVDGVFKEVAIALMYAAALTVTLAMSATRIPSEIERRTVFNVLARDVRRWQYLAGTWAGIVLVTGVALVALTSVAVAAGLMVYGSLMLELFAAAFAVLLEMGVVAAFTLMMTTRVGPVTSLVGAIAFVFIGHSVLSVVAVQVESVPWWVPSLEVFNVIDPIAYGAGYGVVYALAMIAVFLAATALLGVLAAMLFEGRDL